LPTNKKAKGYSQGQGQVGPDGRVLSTGELAAAAHKIQRLTAKQQALIPIVRDEWIAAGLDTRPADRVAAERAIRLMYECGGKKAPERIVWCGSPMSLALTRSIVLDLITKKASVRDSVWNGVGANVWDSVRDSVRDSVGANVWDSVWDSVWASVRDSVWANVGANVWASVRANVGDSVRDSVGANVWDSVGASVRDSVGASVRDSVWDSVRDSVGASVRDSVWDSVRDSVWASVRDSVRASVYGQHDAEWLSFYDFFARIGLKHQTEKLAGLWELGRSAGWAFPHEKICWVSERPSTLALEPLPDRGEFANRLHREDGPALQYPDGWSLHVWHGVRVPPRVIEQPQSITHMEIIEEANAEVARVMLERVGIERFAAESEAKIIHRDVDGQGNTRRLLAIPMPNMPDREARVVVVDCPSTGHQYVLGVPPAMQTCQQAVAWTFGVDVAADAARDGNSGPFVMVRES
jgi:hypothetical protein